MQRHAARHAVLVVSLALLPTGTLATLFALGLAAPSPLPLLITIELVLTIIELVGTREIVLAPVQLLVFVAVLALS